MEIQYSQRIKQGKAQGSVVVHEAIENFKTLWILERRVCGVVTSEKKFFDFGLLLERIEKITGSSKNAIERLV